MRRRVQLIVGSLAVVLASRASAQVMSGELYDASGKVPLPLYDVRLVRIANSNAVVVDSLLTDAKGRFQFNRFGEGTYQLRVGPRGTEYQDPQLDTVAVGDVVLRTVRVPSAFMDVSIAIGDISNGSAVDARFDRGFRGPSYPSASRAKRLNGLVLAFFTVGTDGRLSKPELRATDPSFATAVGDWLPRVRMLPASRDGISVQQPTCLQVVFLISSNARELPTVKSMPDLTVNAEERALCARFTKSTISVVTGI